MSQNLLNRRGRKHHQLKLLKKLSAQEYMQYQQKQTLARKERQEAVGVLCQILDNDEALVEAVSEGVGKLFPDNPNAAGAYMESICKIFKETEDAEGDLILE